MCDLKQISLEDFVSQLDSVIQRMGEEKLVDWAIIEQTQINLIKSLENVSTKIFQLKDGVQRMFLDYIKALKQYDAKDLCSRVIAGKLDQQKLVQLIPFLVNEGNIDLDAKLIKIEINKLQQPWLETNLSIIEKFTELDLFLSDKFQCYSKLQLPEQPRQEQKIEEHKIIEQTDFNLTFDRLNEVVSKIQVIKIPNTNNLINTKTFNQIIDGAVQLAGQNFINATIKNRKGIKLILMQKDRRNHLMTDPKKYVELCLDYVRDIDFVINGAQMKICEKLDLPESLIEESLLLLMERGLGQHIMEIQTMSRMKIKECLPKTKKVSPDQLKEVLRTHRRLLGEKKNLLCGLINSLPMDPDSFYFVTMVLNLALGDMIQLELGYEEEDFGDSLSDPNNFMNDQEMMIIMQDLQTGITAIINSTEIGQQMLKLAEAQQNQQQQ